MALTSRKPMNQKMHTDAYQQWRSRQKSLCKAFRQKRRQKDDDKANEHQNTAPPKPKIFGASLFLAIVDVCKEPVHFPALTKQQHANPAGRACTDRSHDHLTS